MFVPNVRGEVRRKSKARDLFGKATYSDKELLAVGIVNLSRSAAKTTVRADSSATRGQAEEMIADAKLLVLPSASVEIGDLIYVYGMIIEVVSRHPRTNTRGQLDHFELAGRIKEDV